MPRSVPLALSIVPGDPRSIAGQIVDSIRRQVAVGELAVGEKLPSVRALAQQLSINPNTVAKAYAELVANGWLQAQAGLGLFVAVQRDQLSEEERDRRLDASVDRFVNDVVAIRCNPEDAVDRVAAALDRLAPRQSA